MIHIRLLDIQVASCIEYLGAKMASSLQSEPKRTLADLSKQRRLLFFGRGPSFRGIPMTAFVTPGWYPQN